MVTNLLQQPPLLEVRGVRSWPPQRLRRPSFISSSDWAACGTSDFDGPTRRRILWPGSRVKWTISNRDSKEALNLETDLRWRVM
jgi:hypothetical protein